MITSKPSLALGAALLPLVATAAPVAWLDEPAPMPQQPTVESEAASRCTGQDLLLTLGGAGAWRGQATQELLLRNRSGARCRFDGAPAVEVSTHRGWQAVATAEQVALELDPQAAIGVLIGTPGACEATQGPDRQVSHRLRVLAPGGGAMEITGAHVDTTCGLPRMLRLDRHDAKSLPAAGSVAQLTAELSAPRTAVAGTELSYIVTLKNPGSSPVPLSPCPSYEQVLNTEGTRARSALRLNCAGAGDVVPAGGELQFEMHALVPEAAGRAGGVKLSWRLADGPAAGTIIPLR